MLAWLACCATGAHGWDRVLVENPAVGQTADFSVQVISTPDAGGFWAFGTGAARAELVRYDANGQVQTLRYVDPPAAEPLYGDDSLSASSLTSMPDGGAILSLLVPASDYVGYECYLQRYQPNGNLRWTLDTGGDTGFNIASCSNPLVDNAGNVWLQTDDAKLLRLGADGSTLAQISLAAGALAITPAPDGVYVLGSGTLGKYAADGELLWQVNSPLPVTFSSMLLGSDGNIYAFAATPDNFLAAASFDAAGTQRWSKTFAGISTAYVASTTAAADGRIYVSLVAPSSFATQLLAIAPDGTLAWPMAFTAQSGQNCLTPYTAPVVTAANGDVLLLHAPASYCGASVSLFRFKADGTQIYAVPLAGDGYDYAQSVPVTMTDGSTLFVAQRHFMRVSASGAALAAPPTAQVITNTPDIATQSLAADGGSYFVSNDTSTNSHAVSRFSNDGILLWRHTDAGLWAFAKLIEGADRICVAGTLSADAQSSGAVSVSCRGSSSGDSLWTRTVSEVSGVYGIAASVLADRRIVLVYATRHALIDGDGNLLHDVAEPLPVDSPFVTADINASGATVVGVNGITPQFIAMAPDGTTIYNSGYFGSLVVRQALAARVADDGTAILVAVGLSNGVTGIYVMRVDPLGHLLWSHLAPVSTNQNSTPLVSIVTEGNDVGVAIVPTVPDNWLPAPPASLVTDLAFDSGAALWNTLLPTAGNNAFAELIADPAGSGLLLLRDGGNKIALTTFDSASGAIERDRREACVTAYCEPTSTSIDADGALRILASEGDAVAGPVPEVYLVDRPFATPASIRIDQPGLDGAWFPAYEGGQGFTFDWISSASTVFMPWFTFAQSGINDPSGLAWYTLQGGGIATGATSADLAIAVSNPGVFNSGSVPGRQVGTAHLSFTDCNNGTLLYQFDAQTNGGAGGLISLTRLTPSTDPCILADGSTQPAQNVNPPAKGFDAHLSGSWFDPATGGQGVEMTVIPPGNGSAGTVFIPWFTFDPAGASDDALNQHWFTLQGDLSAAANGKVELPIYRIIGGAFDATPTANYVQVGNATLTVQGCDAAQIDYRFDTSEVAHAFAGLAGSSHLVRIGGCIH